MADRYLNFTGTAPGRFLTRRLGLPQPAVLRRWTAEHPAIEGPLLHLTAGTSALDGVAEVLAGTGLKPGTERPAAAVLDATGVADVTSLAEVHAALHPAVRSIATSGRVIVLGAPLVPHRPPSGRRPAGLGGFRTLPRQGARQGKDRDAGPHRARRPPRSRPCASCSPPSRPT